MMAVLGVAILVRHAATAAARCARPPPRAAVRRAPARGASTSHSAARCCCARPRPRLAGAVRDHLDVARERDLLLARDRRRERARADAARLPRRRRVLRADGDDVRRGRVAAPGAGGLDGLRALRLQRAVELRRRLGDRCSTSSSSSPSRRSSRRTTWPRSGRRSATARRSSRSRWRSSPTSRVRNVARRAGAPRASASPRSCVADVALQLLIIVFGAALVVDVDALTASIDLGTAPSWEDLIFALTISTVAFTGLESAAGLAGEVTVGRRGLQRLVASRDGVGDRDLRRHLAGRRRGAAGHAGASPLTGDALDAPVLAIVERFDPPWLADDVSLRRSRRWRR